MSRKSDAGEWVRRCVVLMIKSSKNAALRRHFAPDWRKTPKICKRARAPYVSPKNFAPIGSQLPELFPKRWFRTTAVYFLRHNKSAFHFYLANFSNIVQNKICNKDGSDQTQSNRINWKNTLYQWVASFWQCLLYMHCSLLLRKVKLSRTSDGAVDLGSPGDSLYAFFPLRIKQVVETCIIFNCN